MQLSLSQTDKESEALGLGKLTGFPQNDILPNNEESNKDISFSPLKEDVKANDVNQSQDSTDPTVREEQLREKYYKPKHYSPEEQKIMDSNLKNDEDLLYQGAPSGNSTKTDADDKPITPEEAEEARKNEKELYEKYYKPKKQNIINNATDVQNVTNVVQNATNVVQNATSDVKIEEVKEKQQEIIVKQEEQPVVKNEVVDNKEVEVVSKKDELADKKQEEVVVKKEEEVVVKKEVEAVKMEEPVIVKQDAVKQEEKIVVKQVEEPVKQVTPQQEQSVPKQSEEKRIQEDINKTIQKNDEDLPLEIDDNPDATEEELENEYIRMSFVEVPSHLFLNSKAALGMKFKETESISKVDPIDPTLHKPAHDLQGNSLAVFDYEDQKDTEAAELEKEYYRLGRFKETTSSNTKSHLTRSQLIEHDLDQLYKLYKSKESRFKQVSQREKQTQKSDKNLPNFDEEDLSKEEQEVQKKFEQVMSYSRFKNNDKNDEQFRFKEGPPRPSHDLQAKTLDVFDYEDSKDKEAEDLDNQFIRLGRFKSVDKTKNTKPVYGVGTAFPKYKKLQKSNHQAKTEETQHSSSMTFDENDMTPAEEALDKEVSQFIRFKEGPPKPQHDLQKNTLEVFDYEDSKDKEAEDLDNQFIRLGRFKSFDSPKNQAYGISSSFRKQKDSKMKSAKNKKQSSTINFDEDDLTPEEQELEKKINSFIRFKTVAKNKSPFDNIFTNQKKKNKIQSSSSNKKTSNVSSKDQKADENLDLEVFRLGRFKEQPSNKQETQSTSKSSNIESDRILNDFKYEDQLDAQEESLETDFFKYARFAEVPTDSKTINIDDGKALNYNHDDEFEIPADHMELEKQYDAFMDAPARFKRVPLKLKQVKKNIEKANKRLSIANKMNKMRFASKNNNNVHTQVKSMKFDPKIRAMKKSQMQRDSLALQTAKSMRFAERRGFQLLYNESDRIKKQKKLKAQPVAGKKFDSKMRAAKSKAMTHDILSTAQNLTPMEKPSLPAQLHRFKEQGDPRAQQYTVHKKKAEQQIQPLSVKDQVQANVDQANAKQLAKINASKSENAQEFRFKGGPNQWQYARKQHKAPGTSAPSSVPAKQTDKYGNSNQELPKAAKHMMPAIPDAQRFKGGPNQMQYTRHSQKNKSDVQAVKQVKQNKETNTPAVDIHQQMDNEFAHLSAMARFKQSPIAYAQNTQPFQAGYSTVAGSR